MDGIYSRYTPDTPAPSRPASRPAARRRRRDALTEMNTANECLLFLVSAMFGTEPSCRRPGGPCPKIAEVTTFLRRHFAHEEERMHETGYPQKAEHVAEHRAVLARLDAMYQYFRCGHYDSRIVLDFLENWAVDHIEHYDKPLGHFLVNVDLGDEPASTLAAKADDGLPPLASQLNSAHS